MQSFNNILKEIRKFIEIRPSYPPLYTEERINDIETGYNLLRKQIINKK